jgi:hypothetical protein
MASACRTTPGATNSATATLGSASGLRLNEWMAAPATGPDWFEIFNTNSLPVDMNGLTLTDDPPFRPRPVPRRPLCFIGPNGFVQWIADGDVDQGAITSTSASTQAETLRLYSTNGANFVLIDTIEFGAQLLGVSRDACLTARPRSSHSRVQRRRLLRTRWPSRILW